MKTATKATAKAAGQNEANTPAKKSVKSKSMSKSSYGMDESKLMKLFEDELKDIYWAEKALIKALPKMSKKATADKLVVALENHLQETVGHVQKLEQVFEIIGKKPQAKKCEAMAGLIKESEEIMKNTDAGAMRDAGIISAGQKVEHYEIASYGTLRTFASTLGLNEAAALLEVILEQEKAADAKLSEVAMATINMKAAREKE
ncbi:MAG: ferritin-like domain-containing protein [Bacteroidia bacterium]|nr:ferritin-like domain-containing protein [Bacteroidia bacterium]